MSFSHDNSRGNLPDRLLRYAPWAAAVLVGACVAALIARVVTKADSGSKPDEIVASVDAGEDSQQHSSASPHMAHRSPNATALEDPRASAPGQWQAPVGSPAMSARPAPKAPQTPSSKSRLEMHNARRGTHANEPEHKTATKATTRTFIASSRLLSREVKPNAVHTNSAAEAGWQGLQGQEKSDADTALPESRGYTSFFGIAADGQRFAYVLDRSGSMGEPANLPLREAKAELLASIEQLDGLQQFFLIFYNEDVRQFVPGAHGRHFADVANKTAARRFVESVQAQGGTRHFEALQRAINLRPDVIFLLTDGEKKDDLSADEIKRLSRLNGGLSQIHVIQFAPAPYAGNSLVQLAGENRGQHTYKNIREIVPQPARP